MNGYKPQVHYSVQYYAWPKNAHACLLYTAATRLWFSSAMLYTEKDHQNEDDDCGKDQSCC